MCTDFYCVKNTIVLAFCVVSAWGNGTFNTMVRFLIHNTLQAYIWNLKISYLRCSKLSFLIHKFILKIIDLLKAICYNTFVIWTWLGIAQMVARYLGVVEAVGSNPATQTIKGRWKRYRPQIPWLFKGFLLFKGRIFTVRFCRWKTGIFRYWIDLNSRENKNRPRIPTRKQKIQ